MAPKKKKAAPKKKKRISPKPRKKLAPKKRKAAPKKKKVAPKKKVKLNVIGSVTHYFPHVRAAVIKLKAPLSVGEIIKIKGHTTDFTQNVTSLQMDREPIVTAKKGQEIGLQVDSRVRQHDLVYKV
jgi:outer membrane biosynthesis protein TonB